MLTTFLMTMPGTPYCYYGDELAMTNTGFTSISQYRDMQTLNKYRQQQETVGNLPEYLKNISFGSRDNGRTPFQWNSSANSGFFRDTRWLQVSKIIK